MFPFFRRIILNFLVIFGVLLIPAKGNIDPSDLMPYAKAIISEIPFAGSAVKFWDIFEGTFNVLREKKTESPELQKINFLTTFVRRIDKKIDNVEITTNNKLDVIDALNDFKKRIADFDAAVEKIDESYNHFLDLVVSGLINANDTRTVMREEVLLRRDSMQTLLRRIHDRFYVDELNVLENVLKTPQKELMCLTKKSIQQLIYHYYVQILQYETKAYTLILYASSKAFINKQYFLKLNERVQEYARNQSISRMYDLMNITKQALKYVPRQLWKCNLKNPVEGIDYVKFGPFFQKYVTYDGKFATNEQESRAYEYVLKSMKTSAINAALPHSDQEIRYKKGYSCQGTISDCNDRYGYESHICPLNRTATGRHERYKYVNIEGIFKWGNNECNETDITTPWGKISYFPDTGYEWYTRICTCMDNNKNMLRYVYGDWVTADRDHVITGVRMVPVNNTLYLQIKQGKLSSNFTVASANWKPIVHADKYFYSERHIEQHMDMIKLTYKNRKISLDDAETMKKDQVMTGVRFTWTPSGFRIDADYRYFDFNTGKLNNDKPENISSADWYTLQEKRRQNISAYDRRTIFNIPDPENRKMVNLTGLDMPNNPERYYENNDVSAVNKEYLNLTQTSLDLDFGQTILPFIDIQPVETYPPTPLSGIGLFRRASHDSAGYLALKLITFDYASVLEHRKFTV